MPVDQGILLSVIGDYYAAPAVDDSSAGFVIRRRVDSRPDQQRPRGAGAGTPSSSVHVAERPIHIAPAQQHVRAAYPLSSFGARAAQPSSSPQAQLQMRSTVSSGRCATIRGELKSPNSRFEQRKRHGTLTSLTQQQRVAIFGQQASGASPRR